MLSQEETKQNKKPSAFNGITFITQEKSHWLEADPEVMDGVMVPTVSLMQCRIVGEGNLSKESSGLGWPTGLSVKDFLI